MRCMDAADLERTFSIGASVKVKWQGQQVRGHVIRVDAARRNKDGSTGSVMVRVGSANWQTTTYFAVTDITLV
jgi:hypothetical protein